MISHQSSWHVLESRIAGATWASPPGNRVLRLRGRVVTWVWGGGVFPGQWTAGPNGFPVPRGKNLAGRIWSWWRLCQAARTPARDRHELLAREQVLRGVVGADEPKVRERTVRIRVRAEGDASADRKPAGAIPQKDALKYVTWMVEPGGSVAVPVVRGRHHFTLDIEVPGFRKPDGTGEPDEWTLGELREAVRWWASFDGVCARRTRGLGTVDMEWQAEGEPTRWEPLEPVSEREAKAIGAELVIRTRGRSERPVDAWRSAVKVLKEFRNPKLRQPPGDAWRDPLHAIKHRWPSLPCEPRLALGSPLPFGPGKPRAERADGLRLPSPVIVKARRAPSDQPGRAMYEPVALRLPFDPAVVFDARYVVMDGIRQLGEGQIWPGDEREQEQESAAYPFVGGELDPVSSLMHYFRTAP
jgi:hypothetical protein